MTSTVVRALGALAHGLVHPDPSASPARPCACPAPDVLADRADGTVVRCGPAVAKAHAPGTDAPGLAARLALAADPRLAGVLLPPLSVRPTTRHGRLITLWPYGAPVDPDDPDAAPWEEAAVLLARLHRVRAPRGLAPMRGPVKAARAVARMRAARPGDPATVPVDAAWRRLPDWARAEEPAPPRRAVALCHGDLHLGQLVRHPAPDGRWLLIDIDDLGRGDPTWDLARPAAWYAAGLLPPEVWLRFLDTYRAEGGPAVPPDGDPWPELDTAARALTVQTAALALAKSAEQRRDPDEVERTMIDCCARIAALPPELAPGRPS
ncbi:phosphotransferase family protein [Streptomyces sp. DT171]|uniref:phosphotransferase family protein n=1 Tax=Streptomyces sp. DT171 TaxID=3416524 RepID=UPI003CFB3CD1